MPVPGPERAARFQNKQGCIPSRTLRFVRDIIIDRITCFENYVALLKQQIVSADAPCCVSPSCAVSELAVVAAWLRPRNSVAGTANPTWGGPPVGKGRGAGAAHAGLKGLHGEQLAARAPLVPKAEGAV